MRTLIFIAILIMFVPAAEAASTAWQEISPGTELRLISSDVKSADDTTMLGLEVRLAAGTKTYWRVPGETGIPLQMDFSGSTGINDVRVHWPLPLRETSAGYVDHVYYGEVLFPISLAVQADTLEVSIDLLMGVCSDICIPVTSTLELTSDFTRRDVASDLRIKQAFADVPLQWDQLDPPLGVAAFDEENERIFLSDIDSRIDLSSLIVRVKNAAIVFGAPQKSPITGLVSFERLGWGRSQSLVGETIELVFLARNGPYKFDQTLVGIDQLAVTD